MARKFWLVKMAGKKGLSNVVASVALILLTFVAVGIIAEYIIPLVKDNLNEENK